ncbi:MAG: HAMP domain-containing protein [Opitutaceae bacterium]|nr:HAMP domain-containing protein [Opitutaceae bacterium]
MKSVGFRIAFWYALASFLTLGIFFRIGRHLVEQHIVHSLDTGIAAEFEQVKRRIGPQAGVLSADQLRNQIIPFASVRFGIELIQPDGQVAYRSRNLGNRVIPDQPMQGHLLSIWMQRIFGSASSHDSAQDKAALRKYNAVMGDLGEMRIGEFAWEGMTVRIAVAKEQVRSLVAAYQEVFYILLTLMVVVSSVIGYVLSHILLRPLRQIQVTAEHISSDNLSERIPVSQVQDELSNLARLLNQTFDRLESSFNQVRRFTAEASHELKTPLSLVRLHTEKTLMDGGLSPAQEESLNIVLDEVNGLNRIIEQLLFLSRAEADAITLERQSRDPQPFMENFVLDARVLADSRGVNLTYSHAGAGQVEFDPHWLRQVLLNLLANALGYTPRGRSINIHSQLNADGWRVAICDEGPGVPDDNLERIFERFVRLSHATQHEKGSGLGLAICRSIVNLHQGRIWAEKPPAGSGLCLVFVLPHVQPAGAAASA